MLASCLHTCVHQACACMHLLARLSRPLYWRCQSTLSHPRCTASRLLVRILLSGRCLGPCLPCLVFRPLVWFGPHAPQWGEGQLSCCACMLWHVCSPAAGVWGLLCWGVAPSPALETHRHQASTQASFSWAGVVVCTCLQCNHGGCCCHPLSGDSSDSRGGRLVHQPQAHGVGAAASRTTTRSLGDR